MKGFEYRHTAVKFGFFVFFQGSLQHQIVRGAAGNAQIGLTNLENLVRGAVVTGAQPGIAKSGLAITGNRYCIVLANHYQSCHGERTAGKTLF